VDSTPDQTAHIVDSLGTLTSDFFLLRESPFLKPNVSEDYMAVTCPSTRNWDLACPWEHLVVDFLDAYALKVELISYDLIY
jgi:hypothetical protein